MAIKTYIAKDLDLKNVGIIQKLFPKLSETEAKDVWELHTKVNNFKAVVVDEDGHRKCMVESDSSQQFLHDVPEGEVLTQDKINAVK